jgi:UDP-galactopyranose mutase
METGYKLIVVGSGFFGATIAHKVAVDLQLPVLVIERRNHIGGNAYSEFDGETGVEVHRYGSHLFHTSNEEVWTFLLKFTGFNNYRHRVFTRHGAQTYTMPINLMTINSFFGLDLTPIEARQFIQEEAKAEAISSPQNLEEKAVSLIGRRLYDAFVRHYTAKQWEVDPRELPADIITRLPVRFSFNDFYFQDLYEGLPLIGYTEIFRKMLSHKLIRVVTNCDFFEMRQSIGEATPIVYTGPIDRYFEHKFGELGWRTLDFETERFDIEDFQGASVVNYPDPGVQFTRIHEFKHLHPERRYEPKTIIMREFSRFARRGDEPYYPIGRPDDKRCYDRYRDLANAESNVIFGGRLGTYRYLDMHQAIGAALRTYDSRVAPLLTNGNVGRFPAESGRPPQVPNERASQGHNSEGIP